MLYLGRELNPEGIKYSIRTDPKKLGDSWLKPIALESKICFKTLKEILEILNGEGTFHVEECNEVKVPEGVGIRDVSSFFPIFGEIEKSLEHEGPFFKGPDGETKGHFSFYTIKPKGDLAILVKQTTSSSYYVEGLARQGTIYFLRKDPINSFIKIQVL